MRTDEHQEHDDHGHDMNHVHDTKGIGYDRTDFDIMMLIKMFVFLLVVTVGSYVVCIPIIKLSGGSPAGFFFGPDENFPIKTEKVSPRRMPEQPAPLLQDNVTAHSDMANLRRKEKEHLNSTSTNPITGETTIPIEQAMNEEAAARR